jgi:hypothetical protein
LDWGQDTGSRGKNNSTTDYQIYPKINRKTNSSHELYEQNFQLKSNTIRTQVTAFPPHLIGN